HRYGFDGAPLGLFGTCPSAGTGTLFGQINGLAVTPAATVYVADGITSKVYRIAASGTPAGSIEANHPSTVSTDSRNNIYVPNIFADALEKYAPNGALVTKSTIPLIEAAAIGRGGKVYALAGSGTILVLPPVDRGRTSIRHWQMVGYPPDSGGLDPEGICLDGQGNIWVADIRHNNIQEFAPSGHLLRVWGRGGTAPSHFHNPTALTVDGRGHLFVVDSGNNRVQEFDLQGHFLAMYGREGQAIGQFLTPAGIGTDGQGNLYIGDRGNDRIQELIRR
ncbi:MAG TPA: NHL repeat-containing protein, partial [Chloroflexota bacterium]